MKKMSKVKRLLVILLCLLMVEIPNTAVVSPTTVQAATVKNGLKKEKVNGKYYYFYYVKGQKIKNAWRRIGVRSTSGKVVYNYYYFRSNGTAIQAPTVYKGFKAPKYSITVQKIGGKYYGFNKNGHRISGAAATPANKLYFFNSNGTYNSKKTAQLRNAAKRNANSSTLRKLLGKAVKTKVEDSCLELGKQDVSVYYSNLMVLYIKDPSTKKEKVYAVYARE